MVATRPKLKSHRAQRTVDDLARQVEEHVTSLEEEMLQGHTQRFLDALDFWSQFPKYSYSNLNAVCSGGWTFMIQPLGA